jgi:electron transfer flavoprotein beta subunit
MNVAVCIAPIIDPASVSYDLDKECLAGGVVCANPLDWVALAYGEAYLSERGGGDLVALSVGDRAADQSLRGALTRGADRAIRIATAGTEPGPKNTARLLARAIESLDCELILCGARSADYASEFVATALAVELDLPSISRVVEMAAGDPGRLRAAWKMEGGRRELYSLPLPAVVAVEAELATPAYVPVMSRRYRAGLSKTIEVIGTDGGVADALDSAVEKSFVQAKPRTKRGVAPSSYIGAVGPGERGDATTTLDFTDENADRFVAQITQWSDPEQ